MRWLFALLLCVGCYAPTYRAGGTCETACPGDLICIDQVCREPGYVPGTDARLEDAFVPIDTVDGPPGDADADGVVDATDNCPGKANPDQHDEDADAIGDVCDPCPHLSGTAVDADGDGVGDACDPQPSAAKQRIAFFDPFTSDRTEWSNFSGASRVGETLRILATTSSGGARLNIANGETRVYMGGTIPTIETSTPHQFSVNFGANATGDVYHYVEFYDSGGSNGEIAITERNGSVYTGLASTPYTGVMPTGAWSMQIDESVSAQQMAFSATLGGIARPAISASTADAPALVAGTRINIYTRNCDLRFDYVLVIETLP